MIELFQLEFMQRAFIAGIMLAPLLAVLGSFATLRKMSFFADGIAHASLFGVALAIMVGIAPFHGALIIGVVMGLLVFFLERYGKLASDGVIGIIFTTGLALGIIIISLQPGYQPDLISFLFGNILSVTWSNVWLILGMSLGMLSIVSVLFRPLTLLTLSEELAWTSGVRTSLLNLLFYVLLSLAVVLGVKLLGIILVSALLITPAITSRLITRSFLSYVLTSVFLALLAFIGGLIGSYFFDLPSGASIVMCATILFVGVFSVTKLTRFAR
jgi:ABC-type Mn2+/Zn2+ transport system permease subunit